ncbi:MAG: hypothetical protein HYT68_01070 [Candidatus Zambryskibacteria bacterium]|nr:hypothetical protein [Candidatus Zambryskibacteria bacterium]
MPQLVLQLVLSMIIAALILGAGYVAIKIFVPRWIVQLGSVDSWWSPFQTLPPPGEMYIILRGSKTGPYAKLIHSVEYRNYNESTHEFSDELQSPVVRSGYLASNGVAWVGFNRFLLYREVRHDKWEKLPDKEDFGLISKVRPGPSIYFRYNMAVQIKAAETIGNFPVDGVVVFTAQLMNPVKAFFFAGGWEAQIAAAVTGAFRKHVSDKTIDALREEHKSGASILVKEIKTLDGRSTLNNGQRGSDDSTGLYALFGLQIEDARFVLFDLVTGDPKMTAAVRAKEIATLEAEADKKRGEGEKWRRQERAQGVREEVEAWGSHEVGGQVAMAEAIKEAKPNVLGGGVIASVDATRRPSTQQNNK